LIVVAIEFFAKKRRRDAALFRCGNRNHHIRAGFRAARSHALKSDVGSDDRQIRHGTLAGITPIRAIM